MDPKKAKERRGPSSPVVMLLNLAERGLGGRIEWTAEKGEPRERVMRVMLVCGRTDALLLSPSHSAF